jgi:hypothetical protein
VTGVLTVGDLAAGDLVVTEILQNTVAIADEERRT